MTFVVSRAVAAKLAGTLAATVVLRSTDAAGNTGVARAKVTIKRR